MKSFSIVLKKTGIAPVIAAASILLFTAAPFGQAISHSTEMWQSVDERSLDHTAKRAIVPRIYRTVHLDTALLSQSLANAPMEFTRDSSQNPIIRLPMPDGTFARFRFEESPIIEPGLAKKFPALKAYRAQGVDDPTATSRFDWLPSGFHAIILSPAGTVLIDPYAQGNTNDYITYWKKDAANLAGAFHCDFVDPALPELPADGSPLPTVTSGTQLRTYRLALACTNEYAVAVGNNTISGSLAAEFLIMNRVNGVYERDVAIHMNIIANNNLITYAGDNLTCGPAHNEACTAANDPYTNNDGGTMLDENQATVDQVVGSANYDIGHVFSTGGGGIAQLSVPCTGSKAMGVTGLSNPVGDPFAIDYVAHEMGHQWSANHTFNGTSGSCGGGNRSAGSAYEPGSGITIMAYAGICGNQDLAAHSIDTFHVKSLESIVAYSQTGTGNNCAVTTPTGNTPPTVTGQAAFTIPKQSPFTLTASATDPNGDTLTYDWEEYDLGAATTATPNTDSDGSARPIFRPYSPTTGGTRTFPSMQYILNNANVPPTFTGGFLNGELLPAITRTMNFQVVARDNRAGGGGINTATATVNIDGAAAAFQVTAPNDAISIQRLTNYNVTWAASGSATNVKISLSTDGGTTFLTVLTASTPNNGSATVLIPDMVTSTARIKVEAIGNIYFDISDANFSIVPFQPTPTPTLPPTPTPTPSVACPPGWQAGANMPPVGVTRATGVFFPLNGHFYAMGGRSADAAGSDFTNPFDYNPATNTWTTSAAAYPDNQVSNLACGVLTVIGTPQIYCVGGNAQGATAATARVFSYNPVTSVITALTAADNWPGDANGTTLPGGFAVVSNKLYIIAGFDTAVGSTAQTWEFDPSAAVGARWVQKADYPVTKSYVPATTIAGIIYTGGGADIAGTTVTDSTTSNKFDPVANTWTAIASIPRATGETRAVTINGQMWVLGGGRTAPNPSNEVDIYNPGTNSWTTGAPFTTPRRNLTADSDGTHVFLAGGYDTSGTVLLNTMEIFSPSVCTTPTPTPTVSPSPSQSPSPTISPTPTVSPTPTETPTPSETPGTPTPSPTPSETPSPTPGVTHSQNLSTRLRVGTGNDVGIGGFIVTGTGQRHVLIRGLGPSIAGPGIDALPDPVLELNGPTGFPTVINNDWRDNQKAEIIATGIPPTNNLEAAIVADLDPGAYTAILRGNGGVVGLGLVEIYDLSPTADSKLANISTRAVVNTGADIVIAGFILGGGPDQDPVILRGLGPSLSGSGVSALSDPRLELRNAQGAVIRANDNWMDDPVQKAAIIAAGLGLTNNLESGISESLAPAAYTALLSGVGNATGVGLVEVYDRPSTGPTATPGPTGTPGPTSTPGPTGTPGGTPTPTPPTATPTPGTCTENFDGVTSPALPPGWAASNPIPGDGVLFITSTTSPDSAPNDAFVPDQNGISDKVLDRANVTIQSASATLMFRNNFDSEVSGGVFWDGGVLEVSAPNISNGDFLDVTDAHIGGVITAGGYTGEISGDASNPLAGRMAWSGSSGGYIDTTITLGSSLVGQTVTFRWRFGSDEAVAAPGWRIDNLSITGASCP